MFGKTFGFTCIEVLLALLLLSLGLAYATELNLSSVAYFKKAELQEKLYRIGFSVTEGLKARGEPEQLRAYWQPILEATFPRSELQIIKRPLPDTERCLYTVTIIMPTETRKIELEVLSSV